MAATHKVSDARRRVLLGTGCLPTEFSMPFPGVLDHGTKIFIRAPPQSGFGFTGIGHQRGWITVPHANAFHWNRAPRHYLNRSDNFGNRRSLSCS